MRPHSLFLHIASVQLRSFNALLLFLAQAKLASITEALNRIKQLTRPHSGPWIVAEETLERISTHTTEIQVNQQMSQQGKPSIAVFQPQNLEDGTSLDVLLEAIDSVIWRGARLILIDLSDIKQLDDVALGCLITAYYRAKSVQGSLYLCSVSEEIKSLIQNTGFKKVLQIFDDRDDFERFISEQIADSE